MSKIITIRLNDEEFNRFDVMCNGEKPSSFLKSVLFGEYKVVAPDKECNTNVIHDDWYKLISILEDDFLDSLAHKSGSRDNVTKWAVWLLGVVNSERDIPGDPEYKHDFPYVKIVTNPNGENKPYWSDDLMANIIAVEDERGKSYVFNEGTLEYEKIIKHFNVKI